MNEERSRAEGQETPDLPCPFPNLPDSGQAPKAITGTQKVKKGESNRPDRSGNYDRDGGASTRCREAL